PAGEEADGFLHQRDRQPFSGAAMSVLEMAAALRDEGEGIALPVTEPLGAEAFRRLPEAGVTVGAVEVEDHPVAGGEPVAVPFGRFHGAGADGGEERGGAAHFLNEGPDVSFVSTGEGFGPM